MIILEFVDAYMQQLLLDWTQLEKTFKQNKVWALLISLFLVPIHLGLIAIGLVALVLTAPTLCAFYALFEADILIEYSGILNAIVMIIAIFFNIIEIAWFISYF